MRAIVITEPGGPEVLALTEAQAPTCGGSDVCVAVRAVGLNRADLLQRMGFYPAPPGVPADIPGLEFSGEVCAVGPNATRFAVGDRVMGLVGGGACAEQVVLHEREALPIPHGMSFVEAAAIPEAYCTAWDALFAQMGLSAGESVLIHAVGSGVGTAALQLALCAGARVIGTSRTQAKLDRAAQLGLHAPILATDACFADEVLEATGGKGASVVLDLVGGAYLVESLKAMAPRGRLSLVGLLGGARAHIPLGLVLSSRLSITGTVLRSRPIEEKIALAQAFAGAVIPLLEAGAVRPLVDATFAMANVAEAHRLMASGDVFGKIVLTW